MAKTIYPPSPDDLAAVRRHEATRGRTIQIVPVALGEVAAALAHIGARDQKDAAETAGDKRVQVALEAVRAAHQVELEWSAREASARQQFRELEAGAGQLVLADPGALAETSERISRLRAEADVAASAIEAARARRLERIPGYFEAQAEVIHARAAKLKAEAEKHRKVTDGLLSRLREHEGCDFAPARPSLIGAGVAYSDPVSYTVPRSQALAERAAALEAQAGQLGARAPQQGGQLSGASVEHLLGQVRELDPLVVGPRLSVVEAWAREAQARYQERQERLPSELRRPPKFTVNWRDGRLVQGESRVEPT